MTTIRHRAGPPGSLTPALVGLGAGSGMGSFHPARAKWGEHGLNTTWEAAQGGARLSTAPPWRRLPHKPFLLLLLDVKVSFLL